MDSQAHTAAIVTMVSGNHLVPAALCMHKQLQMVASKYPYHIVYDDVVAKLPESSLAKLQDTFGPGGMVPISTLLPPRIKSSAAASSQSHGRRLYVSWHTELTHLKVWLWALPPERYPQALSIDLDMLVLSNFDHFLTTTLPPHSLIGGKLCKTLWGFSTGIFLFRPSPAVLPNISKALAGRNHIRATCVCNQPHRITSNVPVVSMPLTC